MNPFAPYFLLYQWYCGMRCFIHGTCFLSNHRMRMPFFIFGPRSRCDNYLASPRRPIMETNKHHPEQDTSLSPSLMSSRSLSQHSSKSIFLSESPPSPPCVDCIHDRSLSQEWGTDTTVLTHLAFPLYDPMLAFSDAEGFDSGEGVRCADVSLAGLLDNHLR